MEDTKDTTTSQEEKGARLRSLLAGATPPQNKYSEFILGQIRAISGQVMQTEKQLGAARQQVAELEAHSLKLQGAAEQYILDLQAWDKPAEVPTTPPQPQNGVHDTKAS